MLPGPGMAPPCFLFALLLQPFPDSACEQLQGGGAVASQGLLQATRSQNPCRPRSTRDLSMVSKSDICAEKERARQREREREDIHVHTCIYMYM